MVSEERLQILDMIAQGKITAQQGVELLNALEDEADLAGDLPANELAEEVETQPLQEPETRQGEVFQTEAGQTEFDPAAPLPPIVEAVTEPPAPEAASEASQPMGSQAIPAVIEDLPENPSFDPRAEKWRGWWRIPLWIGVVATVLTGLLLYSIYNAAGFNFWFACAWFPFMISVAIVALAWASRSAHWIHIRVHQRPGERPQNIAISFPIPLSLMGWFLRTFRSKIPNLQGINPDEMILALNHVTPEKPFYVEVNEGDGERVEVYIG
jgi:uncharacterized membrane protein